MAGDRKVIRSVGFVGKGDLDGELGYRRYAEEGKGDKTMG